MASCTPEQELPIVENGPVAEFFVDYMADVEVVGPVFWVTFGRFLIPAGMRTKAKVPLVRVGRTLETYKPNQLARLIEQQQMPVRSRGH